MPAVFLAVALPVMSGRCDIFAFAPAPKSCSVFTAVSEHTWPAGIGQGGNLTTSCLPLVPLLEKEMNS